MVVVLPLLLCGNYLFKLVLMDDFLKTLLIYRFVTLNCSSIIRVGTRSSAASKFIHLFYWFSHRIDWCILYFDSVAHGLRLPHSNRSRAAGWFSALYAFCPNRRCVENWINQLKVEFGGPWSASVVRVSSEVPFLLLPSIRILWAHYSH